MSRVHSQTHSTTSGVNLMTHEYHKGGNGMHLPGNNLTIGNPMNTHGGSGSSISAGGNFYWNRLHARECISRFTGSTQIPSHHQQNLQMRHCLDDSKSKIL